MSVVSIHAPTKGATLSREMKLKIRTSFNPRSHEGSDLPWTMQAWHCGGFNPRSHEGSDRVIALLLRRRNGFNPRSHEGSDYTMDNFRADVQVSIHAPTKGATRVYLLTTRSIRFNPRSHEGSDRNTSDCGRKYSVSIHAPTKGATCTSLLRLYLRQFQSTLPRRERRHEVF